MRRLQLALALALVALVAGAMPVAAGSPPASRDGKASTKVYDKTSAIVVFKSQPLATYDGHLKGYAKTKPAPGKKLNPNSAASKKYVGYLKTQHSAYASWLRKNAPGAKITSNLYSTLNAVGVKLNGHTLTKLRSNTSVSVVAFTTLYQQTLSESHKLINADAVWAKAGGRSDAGRRHQDRDRRFPASTRGTRSSTRRASRTRMASPSATRVTRRPTAPAST